MAMPPASRVGMSPREWPAPRTGPESTPALWVLLDASRRSRSRLSPSADPAAWRPAWGFCFEVICRLRSLCFTEQRTAPGPRMQEGGGRGLVSLPWPQPRRPSGPRGENALAPEARLLPSPASLLARHEGGGSPGG